MTTVSDSFCLWAEEIPSDEDEVNESQNTIHHQSSMAAGQGGDNDDNDDEDDYWDEDAFEGTPLEEYSTPLDYDNGEDEYQVFTSALLSKLWFISKSCLCLNKTQAKGHTSFFHKTPPPSFFHCSAIPNKWKWIVSPPRIFF